MEGQFQPLRLQPLRPDVSGEIRAIPYTTSYFSVENAICANGVTADIRSFGWSEPGEAWFEPKSYYVSYGLTKRPAGTRMRALGQRHYQHPGQILFVSAGLRFAASTESDHRALCINMDSDRLHDALGDAGPGLDDPRFHMDVCNPRVERLLMRILEEVREPGFASAQMVESSTAALMIEIFRHMQHCDSLPLSCGKLADWRLRRLKDRIAADIGTTPSIAELARDCGLSVRHLVRTFKNTEGVTLCEYIANRRIEYAKSLLASDGAMIKQIAVACGFGTAASFAAAFRRGTGKTPKEYREHANRFEASAH